MISKEDFDKLPEDQQKALLGKMADIQAAAKGGAEANLPQLSMKEFEGKIKEVTENMIKGMTAVDRKYFMFPGIGTQGQDLITPEAKFSKTIRFLKALAVGNTQVTREMSEEVRTKANLSEGTTTAGGYLVPEEFAAEIIRLAPQYGVLRRECRIIPMQYDIINIPAAGSTDQSAIWTNEAAQIKQTNPNFKQLTLTINKLAAIPKVTNELLADANIPVVQYLSELVAWAFAKEEDNQGFTGTGSPFVGVLTATGAPTYPHAGGTAFMCLSYPDLVKMTSQIYDNALSNAKFFLHRSMIGHIRSLITTAGAPILGAVTNDVAGYPLVSTEVLPGLGSSTAQTDATPYLVFGDLRRGIAMGERGSIQMKMTTEGTVDSDNLFEKDMAALRFIERVAIGVLLPSAFCVMIS